MLSFNEWLKERKNIEEAAGYTPEQEEMNRERQKWKKQDMAKKAAELKHQKELERIETSSKKYDPKTGKYVYIGHVNPNRQAPGMK